MGTPHIFEQLHEQPHEGTVDESVGHVGVEDDGLEVHQHVQLVVDSPAGRHCVVHVVQMTFDVDALDLRGHVFSRPRFERQQLRIKHQVLVLLNVLVPYDGLDRSV